MAKISILCPSYNHEKYVKYFIESVLNQTEQDFELLILDDCSVDSRIRLIKHEYNKGINASITDLIENSSSDILCLIASDDILYNNYLERILDLFDKNPESSVVYVSLQKIDTRNQLINETIKLNPNISQFEILKQSFLGENMLPSPGMAFKKSAINQFLPLPYGLLNYSDWELHHNLLLNHKVTLTDELLIKYRVSTESASSRSKYTIRRESLETRKLMQPFLNIKDLDLFKSIFEGEYSKYGTPTVETIPYFLARIALTSQILEKQKWGYSVLIDYISQKNNMELLHNLYGFDFKQFANLISKLRVSESEKLIKYKNIYRLFLFIIIFLICIIITLLWRIL